jgi:hypothetical protein
VTTPRLDNLERHCATLDAADPLQSVLLEDCLLSVKGYAATAAFGDCESRVACLRTELRAGDLLVTALKALERALRTGSAKSRRQANRLIDAGGRVSAKVPSSTKQRKTFRSACGPGPVAPAAPPPAPVL